MNWVVSIKNDIHSSRDTVFGVFGVSLRPFSYKISVNIALYSLRLVGFIDNLLYASPKEVFANPHDGFIVTKSWIVT